MEKSSSVKIKYVKVKIGENSYKTYKLTPDEKLVRIKNENGDDDFRVINKNSRLVLVKRSDGKLEYKEYEIEKNNALDCKSSNISGNDNKCISDLKNENYDMHIFSENESQEKLSGVFETENKPAGLLYTEPERTGYGASKTINNIDDSLNKNDLSETDIKTEHRKTNDEIIAEFLKKYHETHGAVSSEKNVKIDNVNNTLGKAGDNINNSYMRNQIVGESKNVHSSSNMSGNVVKNSSGRNFVNNSSVNLKRTDDRVKIISVTDTQKNHSNVLQTNEEVNKVPVKMTAGVIIKRSLLVFVSIILLIVIAVFSTGYTLANGPSPSVRNQLVLMASGSSAMGWAPYLFLSKKTVDKIISDSHTIREDIISLEDYFKGNEASGTESIDDKFRNAKDGMIYETVNGPTYKAYVLLIKDPERVSLGISSDDFKGSDGIRFYELAEKYDIVASINGGEYPDRGGGGDGSHPIGLTYSDGKCVWDDGELRSFVGFTKENKLVASENMTRSKADEIGIRDGCCFQTGNTLISNENENITIYRADSDTGTAQRTAIGQCADGSVILVVTDGRSASSLGATHNDIIDLMVSYGAVCAGMLDGGSSTMMYYENYFDKYNIDKNTLDEYQKMGLVNKYKAFTTPRKIPTYFMVKK